MKVITKVEGKDRLKRAIEKHRRKLARGFEHGSLKSMQYLHEQANELVPMETGLSHDTSYVRQEESGFRTVTILAYVTPYIVYVHNDLSKKHGEEFNVAYAGDISQRKGPLSPKGKLRRPQEVAQFLKIPRYNPIVLDVMAGIMNRHLLGQTVFIASAAVG